jgi:hypothetical protein
MDPSAKYAAIYRFSRDMYPAAEDAPEALFFSL